MTPNLRMHLISMAGDQGYRILFNAVDKRGTLHSFLLQRGGKDVEGFEGWTELVEFLKEGQEA
jgi:hypothetical protein